MPKSRVLDVDPKNQSWTVDDDNQSTITLSLIAAGKLDETLSAVRGEFERDVRAPADNRRRATFRIGWHEAQGPKEYRARVLCDLTWQNLGYRLGRAFGTRPDAVIDDAFGHCVAVFPPGRAPTEVSNAVSADMAVAGVEGTPVTVVQVKYERDPKLREICLAHHGVACVVCGVKFAKEFPTIEQARDFIHVHHLRPLSEVTVAHRVDPVADMVPLCPNCHGVAHLRRPPFTVTELKVARTRAR